MGMIILSVLVAIGVFVGFYLLHRHDVDNWEIRKRNNESYKREFTEAQPVFNKSMPLAISSIVVLLTLAFECFTVIPAGHIGVQVTLGEVNQQTLSEGAHFVNPISRVKEVEVRLTTYRTVSYTHLTLPTKA